MKYYMEKSDIDKLNKPEELHSIFVWQDYGTNHNYEITISKIKKIDNTPFKQKLRKKWNAFVRKFLL